jgi:DNA-binding NarL/FixJ family response regulator
VNQIRLGVLDRDRMMTDGLSAWLESFSDRVELVNVASSWEGLFIGTEFPYDVVLMDVTMAEDLSMPMKFQSVAGRGAKTLAMSPEPDPVIVQGAIAAGAHGYVAKTEGLMAVADAIRQVADTGSHISGEVTALLTLAAEQAPLPPLTKQEIRVLALYAQGHTMKHVAYDLSISSETARTYMKQLRQKCLDAGYNVSDKVSLHQFAVKAGLLQA